MWSGGSPRLMLQAWRRMSPSALPGRALPHAEASAAPDLEVGTALTDGEHGLRDEAGLPDADAADHVDETRPPPDGDLVGEPRRRAFSSADRPTIGTLGHGRIGADGSTERTSRATTPISP